MIKIEPAERPAVTKSQISFDKNILYQAVEDINKENKLVHADKMKVLVQPSAFIVSSRNGSDLIMSTKFEFKEYSSKKVNLESILDNIFRLHDKFISDISDLRPK